MVNKALYAAEKLWNYHYVPFENRKADFALVLGSRDIRVAKAAAQLYLRGSVPLLVISGGVGKVTKDTNKEPESSVFAARCIEEGVSASAIIEEPRASNTGDNFVFSKALLSERKINPNTGIIVTKPYMRRRSLATGRKQWPEIDWQVFSEEISIDEYFRCGIDPDEVINLMVGDLQRLKVYADNGFQVPQDIPEEIWAAYNVLVSNGYDRFVIK
jgi:uncharacterized SAM-binding protein YcdF (DUF218 family)